MRSIGQNQNKFLRIISTPLRALSKARDFYVRSITGCSAQTHYPSSSSSSSSVSAPFPRSRSSSSAAFSSSASTRRTTDFDDYSELVRAASVRSLGHKNEIDMFIQEKRQHEKQKKKLRQGGLPKSSSVGMARIEEDEEAEEGSVNPKTMDTKKVSDILYPRSKSYAVTEVDKSTKYYNQCEAGLGWIFHPTSDAPESFSASESSVTSALMAEALALRQALCSARNHSLRRIAVYSDSLQLVNLINSGSSITEIHGILADISILSSSFDSCCVLFIKRFCNGLADTAAKTGLNGLGSLPT